MKCRFAVLMRILAAPCLLAWCAGPAGAYVGRPPPTLGDLCRQATHIYLLKVEKFSAEKGVILFKPAQQLKAPKELPDDALAKQVIGPKVNGAKIILDWAGNGKTAVLFGHIDGLFRKQGEPPPGGRGPNGAAYVYIDNYWYLLSYDTQSACWSAVSGEPAMLAHYCGTAEKLGASVPKILRGEEVVVSAMVGGNKEDLEQRRGKVRDVRVSLKPDLVGKIQTLSEDGKRLTLLPEATATNKAPAAIEIQITESTRIIAIAKTEIGKLAVGQFASVWLEIGDEKTAATVQVGKAR
jgi:hypothetical protein